MLSESRFPLFGIMLQKLPRCAAFSTVTVDDTAPADPRPDAILATSPDSSDSSITSAVPRSICGPSQRTDIFGVASDSRQTSQPGCMRLLGAIGLQRAVMRRVRLAWGTNPL